jgi:hypothetical protein
MVALPPLATPEDLGVHLGEAIAADDARALRILRNASGAVRAAAGYQQFSRVDDDVVVLRGGGPVLELPQRPVIAVTAINGLTTDQWAWDGGQRLGFVSGGWWGSAVQVTYSHGYDDIPDDVVGIVLTAAARAWMNPAGLVSETVGAASFQYDTVVLTADELRAARRAGGLT